MSKLEEMEKLRNDNFLSIGQCLTTIKFNEDKLERLLVRHQELIRKIQRLKQKEEE
jgi:hypothetical protein